RELVLLEFHIALTLLLEADSDPMADELMRQRARDVRDSEPENDLLERRSVPGLQPLGDELANRLAGNFLGFDLVPDFDWRVGGIAGAKRRVEFFQRLLGVVDQLDLHFRLMFHAILTPPANGRALDAATFQILFQAAVRLHQGRSLLIDTIYRHLLKRYLFARDAERAHRMTLRMLAALPAFSPPRDRPELGIKLWGIDFPNPIGLAAGMDKDAAAIGGW